MVVMFSTDGIAHSAMYNFLKNFFLQVEDTRVKKAIEQIILEHSDILNRKLESMWFWNNSLCSTVCGISKGCYLLWFGCHCTNNDNKVPLPSNPAFLNPLLSVISMHIFFTTP